MTSRAEESADCASGRLRDGVLRGSTVYFVEVRGLRAPKTTSPCSATCRSTSDWRMVTLLKFKDVCAAHNGTLEEMYALPGDARRNGTVACGSDGASKCDVWTGIFSAMGWCYRYYIEPGTGVLRRFEEWLTPPCHGDPTQITAIDGVELPASVPSSDLEPPSNCTAAPVCGGGGAAAHGTATTRPRSAYALVAAILAAGDRTKV